MSKYNWKNIKGLGLSIVAFEATEHLVNIISELRDVVDYVSIGLQRKSYHGDPIDPTDLNEIFRLRDEDHLVDNIVEINLDSNKEPRVQETDKRNILIQDAEDHGCTHVIVIDSDEYYIKKNFLKALKEIDENDYEMTYCQYVNYYHDYKHYLVYPFLQGMYVPFVSKTKYRHSFDCQDFPYPSDPTRRYVRPFDGKIQMKKDGLLCVNENNEPIMVKNYTANYHIFDWNTINMHHLSCLRADIRKKFNDWSSKTCFEDYNDLIDRAVDDYENFDENSTETQWAHLLFNTPDHKVRVNAFPKQYIQPAYDFRTRLRPVKTYKRIAIMNLSSTNSDCDLFNKLDQCAKETWARDVINGKYPNIEYWTVLDWAKESHIDLATHTIYVKTDYKQDNTLQLLNRWLEGYRLLSYIGYYDWIIRTNTSTWNNIELLNEFLANETSDFPTYTYKLFSAYWSKFNTHLSGATIICSARTVELLLNKKYDDLYNKLRSLGNNDDMIISTALRLRAEQIGLKEPNKCFHSLEGKFLNQNFKDTDFDNVDLTVPMYQIKTFINNGEVNRDHNVRLINDIAKMKKLQECWDLNRDNFDIEQLAKDLRNNMDKTINVIPYSKQEWFDESLTDIEKQMSVFNEMPYNQETLDYLGKLQKDNY